MTFELLLELDYFSSLEGRYRLTQSRTSPVSSVDVRGYPGPTRGLLFCSQWGPVSSFCVGSAKHMAGGAEAVK